MIAVTYCLQAQEASLADRQNMIFAGTQIVGGKVQAIVAVLFNAQ